MPFSGIPNKGNTCFWNAATQAALSIEPLKHQVENRTHTQGCNKAKCFVCAWEKFASEFSKDPKADPTSAIKAFARHDPCYNFNSRRKDQYCPLPVLFTILEGYNIPGLRTKVKKTELCTKCMEEDKLNVVVKRNVLYKLQIVTWTRDHVTTFLQTAHLKITNLLANSATTGVDFSIMKNTRPQTSTKEYYLQYVNPNKSLMLVIGSS